MAPNKAMAGEADSLVSDSALRLFAASNRNLRNRLIHCGSLFAGSLAFVDQPLPGLWLAAALALVVGIILIGAGLLRMGWIADLLSIPVTTGNE